MTQNNTIKIYLMMNRIWTNIKGYSFGGQREESHCPVVYFELYHLLLAEVHFFGCVMQIPVASYIIKDALKLNGFLAESVCTIECLPAAFNCDSQF